MGDCVCSGADFFGGDAGSDRDAARICDVAFFLEHLRDADGAGAGICELCDFSGLPRIFRVAGVSGGGESLRRVVSAEAAFVCIWLGQCGMQCGGDGDADCGAAAHALRFGWQAAFVWTGAMGLVLLVVWVPLYGRPEEHRWVGSKELALILSDPAQPVVKVPWRKVIRYRQAWIFMAGKMFTDGIFWFFITWLPLFFFDPPYNLNLKNIGWPLVVIYLLADIGAVAGGALSSVMMRRGISANRARKTAMLICGACALPIMFAPHVHNMWAAVLIVGLAVAGHQGYSSNLYTVVSDLFPKSLVASIAGLGGFCGYVGASLFQVFTGKCVEYTHNYYGPFFCAAIAYVVSVTIMHLISPEFTPAVVQDETILARE